MNQNNSIVISKNFEESNSRLQTFSKKIPNNYRLSKVPETTFFGLMDSNVTGESLNKVVDHFQKRSFETNTYLISIIEEFKTIYNTFDHLDKEYIKKIIIAIESAAESSKQADKNYRLIEDLVSKLQSKFSNVKSEFELISKNVKTVTGASEKINEIEHLEDIDAIYSQAFKNKSSIGKINEELREIIDNQHSLKLDLIERLRMSSDFSLKNIKESSSKLTQDLETIKSEQNDLKIDILERIDVKNQNSFKILNEYTNKLSGELAKIRVIQNDIKLDYIERLKVNNDIFFKKNKKYSNKLTFVTIVAVLSLLISISMAVLNLMKNV
jgi:hypothetical protein